MENPATRIADFVNFVGQHIKGDEKGEAQIFCDRLFKAFGHAGILEAGGTLEYRVHPGKSTKFADLLWPRRVLLEMKKRGDHLQKHYHQALEYWENALRDRPRYVVLCNFDEFWIYDFDLQMGEPVDRIKLEELPQRFNALAFLFPEERPTVFRNNLVAVTRKAADKVAQVFNQLVSRKDKPIPRERAQRFLLQCVIAMFAEDIDLLPRDLFVGLLQDCKGKGSSYDLLGGLFRQMASPTPAEGGRYVGVPYFNGGLFHVVEPIELKVIELTMLTDAATEDWSKVHPVIFGTLFEQSMDQKERHAFGAHYTSEADIRKVVVPTIVRPWRERIEAARTAKDLIGLRNEMLDYHVLDPACGSGNFLYVAYRELKRLEMDLMEKIATGFSPQTLALAGGTSLVSASQFFGIDIKPFAVELAKVTLMMAKKLALDETKARHETGTHELLYATESALPLDNLDDNIRCDDALFCDWPKADAIIGNPPYLGSRFLAKEHGYEYARKIYARFPDVPKMADYCVYWFRRAHDALPLRGRAGLVATNTVRQNETREGSLDYINAHGGTITEAVSTQVWSGEAAVHVSIVNWVKGDAPGRKKLLTQKGNDPNGDWKVEETDSISTSLSTQPDVTGAEALKVNQKPKKSYVGQYPFHEGFLLPPEEARRLLTANEDLKEVIFPYMIGRDLVENNGPSRWIIDFGQRDILEAMRYPEAFAKIKASVMPTVLQKAEKEKLATGKDKTRWTRMVARWWQFRDYQPGTMAAIANLPRYIACSRVTKRPIFEFVSNAIHPDNTLVVFPFLDDYSFGILQSGIHWAWFTAKCSTLTERFRYTSDTVFDTFPWPQAPTVAQATKIAAAAVALRALRRKVMGQNKWSLRDLYRSLDMPGQNRLQEIHDTLDVAVREGYGMAPKQEPLAFLLVLNKAVADREAAGQPVTAPGLPPCVTDAKPFTTDDCICTSD